MSQNAILMIIADNLVPIVLRMDGNLHYNTQNNEDGVDRTLDSIETYRGQKMSILESERHLPISGRPLPISSVREL